MKIVPEMMLNHPPSLSDCFSLSFQVVYVPTSTTSQDQLLEQQMSLVRERQVKLQSIQTDTMLDLPPQIPISKDGEEGYIDSQKHLMCKRSRQISDQLCFRPPPNKNVHDIDLERPPPYYSNSSSLENLEEPPTRIVRDSNGLPVMYRCYSMSSNGQRAGISQSSLTAKTHSRTLSTNSAGRTRTVLSSSHLSEHLDEPPDYTAFPSENSTQNSPTLDNKV